MDFKKLSSKDKLIHILELQSAGNSRKEIADNMGYTRLDTLDRFMSRLGYIKQDGKYISNANTVVEEFIQGEEIADKGVSKGMADVVEDKYPANAIQSKEKLTNIINNYDELVEMLEWFKEVKAKYPASDLPIIFDINYEKSTAIKTTVRVDEVIWKEFSTLCNTRYAQYSKIDIASQILKNFIDDSKQ